MSTKNPHPLGELIAEAIQKSGIKQATIAERMNVSRQAINKIATRKTFDLEFLQRLKDAAGLDFTGYVFDPKSKKYVDFSNLPVLREPNLADGYGNNTVELSLSIRIKAQPEQINDVADLIRIFKKEATKKGFQIA